MKELHLKIITPYEIMLDEYTDMVSLPTPTGSITILPNHDSYSFTLAAGVLLTKKQNSEKKLTVFGGFATIENNVLKIITPKAQWLAEADSL